MIARMFPKEDDKVSTSMDIGKTDSCHDDRSIHYYM